MILFKTIRYAPWFKTQKKVHNESLSQEEVQTFEVFPDHGRLGLTQDEPLLHILTRAGPVAATATWGVLLEGGGWSSSVPSSPAIQPAISLFPAPDHPAPQSPSFNSCPAALPVSGHNWIFCFGVCTNG